MAPTVLSVNLNKIALLRNSRGRDYPSVETFGRLALAAGAGGLTLHPRPDQRHARYSDIATLSALVAQWPEAELNIEGYPSDEFIAQVLKHRPAQCTLVPDAPDQLTSDHGWQLTRDAERLRPVLERLKAAGIRSSLFVDPSPEGLEVAAELGADRLELYTEAYAQAFSEAQALEPVLAQYAECAQKAQALGLGINAGHDLNLSNLSGFLQAVPAVLEVSIGHALTVESLSYGWESCVERYVALCRS